MSVELKYKDVPEMSYKWSLLSTVLPDRLELIEERCGNIFNIVPEYKEFVLKPTKENVKKLLEKARLSYYTSQYSIVYRNGMPDADFYFWLAYLQKFNFTWDNRVSNLSSFEIVFFDYIGYVWNKKQGIVATIKHLSPESCDFFKYLGFSDKIVVDLRNDYNNYILGYIMRYCKHLARKVRIIPSEDTSIPFIANSLFNPLKDKDKEKFLKCLG